MRESKKKDNNNNNNNNNNNKDEKKVHKRTRKYREEDIGIDFIACFLLVRIVTFRISLKLNWFCFVIN